ncbi:MAG: LptA/OstA family protein, partial [Acidobacteriota bacterium]
AGGGDPGAGDPGRLRIHAETLEMEMTPDGRHPADLHLEGGPGGRTTVRSFGAGGGPVYRLEAPRIDGLFEEGRPATFEAAERVRVEVVDDPALVERAVEAELASWWAAVSGDRQAGSGPGAGDESEGLERWGEGRRAEAAFDATGALATVTLIDDVEIVDGETRARGDRGVFRASDDAAEVTGEPARVVTPRTAMEAPTVTYTRADGILHGSGGVRARLERDGDGGGPASALDGTPLGEGEGPVWVEAEQGFFRDRPRSFLFAGSVRAWKGEDLLTGSRLRGEEAEGTLTASGDVRTLWIPEPADPEGDPRPEDSPIEVTADEMTYRRGRSVLVYTGDVVAEQERRMLACREMEMHLRSADGADEARKEGTGRLERLICTGAVRMSEPAAGPDEGGRTLRGHRAVYDPAARTIDVVAGPGGRVVMEDPDGNVIEGPRMIYEIDRERVRMLPLEEADGEATPDPGEGESQGETEDQTGDESGGGP